MVALLQAGAAQRFVSQVLMGVMTEVLLPPATKVTKDAGLRQAAASELPAIEVSAVVQEEESLLIETV